MTITPYTIASATGIPEAEGETPGPVERAADPAFVVRAEAEARRVLGPQRYAEIALDASAPAGSVEAEAYLAVQTAMSLLAFAAALPTLNLRSLGEAGGFVGSTGLPDNQTALLSQYQIRDMQKELRDQAHALLVSVPLAASAAPPQFTLVRSLR